MRILTGGGGFVFVGRRPGRKSGNMVLNDVLTALQSARQAAGVPLWIDPKQNVRTDCSRVPVDVPRLG